MKNKDNLQKAVIISIVCLAIILLSIFAYLKSIANSNKNMIGDTSPNLTSDLESASTQIGKSVNEVSENKSNDDFENAIVINNTTKNTTTNTSVNKKQESKVQENKKEEVKSQEDEKVEPAEENVQEQEKEDPKFNMPVSGEIIREFANDSLVYSNTLEEWITHNGIDIKADKTSVVTASAPGKVYAIKNDPRYGLTVIIDHDNGYRSIYSNLLTSEFVVEGENVKQGQTIGTVGNTATFEISDDCHLHFELLKDNEYVDPTIYINFN